MPSPAASASSFGAGMAPVIVVTGRWPWAWTAEEFADAARRTPGGLHVDTTGWTVAETVHQILDRLDEARVA